MTAQVDPVAGLVRIGDRSWPFDLDLRAGSAAIEVDGRRLVVRPLSWQEKLRLARHAHLGGDFIERQLVRLCLVDGAAQVALDGPAEQAVAAAARWINEPDPAAPAEPLDPTALGRVAIEVCRGTGLSPGDLAGREAAEVEELYRAMTVRPVPAIPSGPDPTSDGVSRIMIVPDPPAPAEAAALRFSPDADPILPAAGPAMPAGSAGPAGPVASGGAGGPAAGSAHDVPPEPRGPARRERPAVRRFQVSGGLGVGELPLLGPVGLDGASPGSGRADGLGGTPLGPGGAASRSDGPSVELGGGQFGPGGATGPGEATGPGWGSPGSDGGTPGGDGAPRGGRSGVGGQPYGVAPAITVDGQMPSPGEDLPETPRDAWSGPGHRAVEVPTVVRTHTVGRAPDVHQPGPLRSGSAGRLPSVVLRRLTGPEALTGYEAPPSGRVLGADERDELFDEVCERLEQAATEMGVDVGGW